MKAFVAFRRYGLLFLVLIGGGLIAVASTPSWTAFLDSHYITGSQEILVRAIAEGALLETPEHVEHNFTVAPRKVDILPPPSFKDNPADNNTGASIKVCGERKIFDRGRWNGDFQAFVHHLMHTRHPLCHANTTAWVVYEDKTEDGQILPRGFVTGCVLLYPMPNYITDHPNAVIARYCQKMDKGMVVPSSPDDFLKFAHGTEIFQKMNTARAPAKVLNEKQTQARDLRIFNKVQEHYSVRATEILYFGLSLLLLGLMLMLYSMRSLYREAFVEHIMLWAKLGFTFSSWLMLRSATEIQTARTKRERAERERVELTERQQILLARAQALTDHEALGIREVLCGTLSTQMHPDFNALDQAEASIAKAETAQTLRARARDAAGTGIFDVVASVNSCLERGEPKIAEVMIARARYHKKLLKKADELQTAIRPMLRILGIKTPDLYMLHDPVRELLLADEGSDTLEQAEAKVAQANDLKQNLNLLNNVQSRIKALPVAQQGQLPEAMTALVGTLDPTRTIVMIKLLKAGIHTLLQGRTASGGRNSKLVGLENAEAAVKSHKSRSGNGS